MSGGRQVKAYIKVMEKLIRTLLCKRVSEARGNVVSIKAGRICLDIYGSIDAVPLSCRMAVRDYVFDKLREAVVHELSNRYRIVLDVRKARELLRCEELEDQNIGKTDNKPSGRRL